MTTSHKVAGPSRKEKEKKYVMKLSVVILQPESCFLFLKGDDVSNQDCHGMKLRQIHFCPCFHLLTFLSL